MIRLNATLVMLITAVTVNAEECRCRSKHVVAFEGDVVCLSTANGWQLARCEKVLNNTAWKFLSKPCAQQTTDSKHRAAPVVVNKTLVQTATSKQTNLTITID